MRISLKKNQDLPLSHSSEIPGALAICIVAACLALMIMVSASPISWVRAQEPPEEPLNEERPSFHGMNAYYGDLHQHSGYSDREACGLPEVAYQRARARGNDFLVLTEHHWNWASPYIGSEAFGCRLPDLEPNKWERALELANEYNEEGEFVALRGYEWTFAGSGYGGPTEPHKTAGHINILNSDIHPAPWELMDIYNWLAGQPITVVAHLNHPDLLGRGLGDHDDYAYHAGADSRVWGIECDLGYEIYTAYPIALNRGWEISAVGYGDGNQANVAGGREYGVFAPNITRADLIDALNANRTFGSSHPDSRHLGELAVAFFANGHWMGSTIPRPEALEFEIFVADYPRDGSLPDEIQSIEILSRAQYGVVARIEPTLPVSSYIWHYTLEDLDGYDYFYVQVRDKEGEIAWSAPIRLSDETRFRVQPSYLFFHTPVGGELPPSQTVHIDSNDGQPIEWQIVEDVPWLDVTPMLGETLPQTLTVSVNMEGVEPGCQAGIIRLESLGDPGVAWVISTAFLYGDRGDTLLPEIPDFRVDPYLVEFEFEKGTSSGTQMISLMTDQAPWAWDSWADVDWIEHTPESGTSSAYIAISVDDSSLLPGRYDGHLTITGGNRTWTITVRVHIKPVGSKTVFLQNGLGGYNGAEDTYLSEWARDENYAMAWSLYCRASNVMVPMIRFDLSEVEPAAILHEATLDLFVTHGSEDYWLVAGVYEVMRPWEVEAVTWRQAMNGVSWQASGAQGSEDVARDMSYERILFDEGNWYSFDVTDMVRSWLRNPSSNNGLLLRAIKDSREYRFYSSDHPSANWRPRLAITYTTIQPTATPTITPTPTPTATPSPTLLPTTVPPPTATPSPLPQACLPLVLK